MFLLELLGNPWRPEFRTEIDQVVVVAAAGDHPEKFGEDRSRPNFAFGEQRKTLAQRESGLVSEEANRSDAGPVVASLSVCENIPQGVIVGCHDILHGDNVPDEHASVLGRVPKKQK